MPSYRVQSFHCIFLLFYIFFHFHINKTTDKKTVESIKILWKQKKFVSINKVRNNVNELMRLCFYLSNFCLTLESIFTQQNHSGFFLFRSEFFWQKSLLCEQIFPGRKALISFLSWSWYEIFLYLGVGNFSGTKHQKISVRTRNSK